MPEQPGELWVRVALDRPNHVRRDEPRQHGLIEEHTALEPLGMAALAPSRLENVAAAFESGGVGRDLNGRGSDVELLA